MGERLEGGPGRVAPRASSAGAPVRDRDARALAGDHVRSARSARHGGAAGCLARARRAPRTPARARASRHDVRPARCLVTALTTIELRAADGSAQLMVPAFSLRVVHGPDAGKLFRASRERIVIGTGDTADLVLADKTVSRFHCEV